MGSTCITPYHATSYCNALASLARRLCTDYVDPAGLTAFTACRLIALDKCPGVRPIGVLRRSGSMDYWQGYPVSDWC